MKYRMAVVAAAALAWTTSAVAQDAVAQDAAAPAAEAPPSAPAVPATLPAGAPPTAAPGASGAPIANPPVAAAGNAEEAFKKIFDIWKGKLQEIRTLQLQYRDANEADRPALEAQFKKLVDESKAIVPSLTAAAEASFAANPKDAEVGQFLHSVMLDDVNRDNFESAYRLARLLIDNRAPINKMELFAGVAAAQIGELDAAEKYLTIAKDNGDLQPSEGQPSELQTRVLSLASNALATLEQQKQFWAKEQEIRAAEAKANDLPRVKFDTTEGTVVLELFENEAPNTVANFVNLVEKGYYDGLVFHRVLPGFMAQGGDPRGDGTGGPGYTIADECRQPNYRHHFRGSLSMAKTAAPDTGGSQFFLTFIPTSSLDGQHTVFGRVIEGIDVLGKLQRVDPDQPTSRAAPKSKIVKATVVRKRDHEYKPKTTAE